MDRSDSDDNKMWRSKSWALRNTWAEKEKFHLSQGWFQNAPENPIL